VEALKKRNNSPVRGSINGSSANGSNAPRLEQEVEVLKQVAPYPYGLATGAPWALGIGLL